MNLYHSIFLRWNFSLTLGLLGLCSCGSPSSPSKAQTPPNILWILAEDLSPDLGSYGHPLVFTPHLDELAAKGVRFTQVFTTAPVCAPSRTALATGMYQTSLDAHHMRYPDSLKNELPSPVVPLNELMRRQGYQTANIVDFPGKGKTDWSFRSNLAHYDRQHWDSLDSWPPFFATVNLRLTHRPFERDTLHPIDPDQVKVPPYYPDHSVSREDWSQYLETVQVMDQQVGHILEELKARGLADNTLVFFFSDHGRPMTRAKNYHFDSGTHIPLILYAPKDLEWQSYLPPGTTNEQLLSALDISATTLAIAGADKPRWMQGRVFLGPKQEEERMYVYSASDRIGGTFFKTRSVRSKAFKYIRNFNHNFSVNSSATAYRKQMHPLYHVLNIYEEMGKLSPAQKALVDPMPEELLFDMQADPFEVHNLATDTAYAEVLLEMRRELESWQHETDDQGRKEDSRALTQAFQTYREQSHLSRADHIAALEKEIREKLKISNLNTSR